MEDHLHLSCSPINTIDLNLAHVSSIGGTGESEEIGPENQVGRTLRVVELDFSQEVVLREKGHVRYSGELADVTGSVVLSACEKIEDGVARIQALDPKIEPHCSAGASSDGDRGLGEEGVAV